VCLGEKNMGKDESIIWKLSKFTGACVLGIYIGHSSANYHGAPAQSVWQEQAKTNEISENDDDLEHTQIVEKSTMKAVPDAKYIKALPVEIRNHALQERGDMPPVLSPSFKDMQWFLDRLQSSNESIESAKYKVNIAPSAEKTKIYGERLKYHLDDFARVLGELNAKFESDKKENELFFNPAPIAKTNHQTTQ